MEFNPQISQWIHREIIGKGSYGTVSLAVRNSDHRYFAVKSAVKSSLTAVTAIENEIEILRSLSSSSPFIVDYYGDDETGSHRNLHVEYLPGGDVAKCGPVDDVDLIRSYTCCLVMALKAVHSQGIVHCDVKGSNILVVGSTSGVIKLADFGSSIRIDDQRGKIVPRGSPLWMAPEVVRGESQGFEADVWSIGCTVIEMFTGMPAWQDHGAHTLFEIGYSNDLPEYPARLPELGRDFLNKCLSRNPSHRWSCDQLLQHPFLLPVPSYKIKESSPRSILDLHFSDDDDDDLDLDEVSARCRISELATTSGVFWESDGWVEVRNENRVVDEGTSWEYFDLVEDNEVISARVVLENSIDYPTWINLEGNYESGGGGDGGLWCGDGVEGNIDLCGVENVIYVLINLLVLLYLYLEITNDSNKNKKRLFLDHMIYSCEFNLCFDASILCIDDGQITKCSSQMFSF